MTKSEIRLLAIGVLTIVVCIINFWVWTFPRINDYYEDTSNLDDSAEVIPSDTLQKDQGKIPDFPFDRVEHSDGTVSLRLKKDTL